MSMRRGLLAKYVTLIVALVSFVLIASSAVGLYFSSNENVAQLGALQHEKALAAATRIELYIEDIEHQMAWTTLPQLGSGTPAIEQRRYEYLKLLRQTPAISELLWIDKDGKEQLRVSRLALDVAGAGTDYSEKPAFRGAAHKVYYGPVYFRKETEPYMTIARPAGGAAGGVIAAEVNLKFVWEVVTQIKVGANGVAYVVNSDGILIAHPDISLVLQKTDLRKLPQVAAVVGGASAVNARAFDIASDLKGGKVLSAHAPIPILGWQVFVEAPLEEAFAPLYSSIYRTGWLLLGGLVLSVLASLFLARRMVMPVRALQAGAAKIGAGELDQRIEVRSGDELEALADQFNTMTERLRESYADLEKKVEDRTRDLSESLAQQTATAEILRVISNSPTDVQPVLDAVAERAQLLCDGGSAFVFLRDGDLLRRVAVHGPLTKAKAETQPLDNDSVSGTAFCEKRTVHVIDLEKERERYPITWRVIQPVIAAGTLPPNHTMVSVPLLKEGEAIGTIMVRRIEVRPFTDKQIALLRTFADQAVIAIENARLFNDTRDALRRQTATAEILGVISRTTTDVKPVFEAIVSNCSQLFDGAVATLWLAEGDRMVARGRAGVDRNSPVPVVDEIPLDRDSSLGTCVLEARMVHLPDLAKATDRFPRLATTGALAQGYGSLLVAPLLRDGKGIGGLVILRRPAGEFTAKEQSLLGIFADQATIAIENVRLFNETKEALERQTATADVLRAISASPTDVQPVLDTIASRAARLCEGRHSVVVYLGEGKQMRRVASVGELVVGSGGTQPLDARSVSGRAMVERRPVHVPNLYDEREAYPLTWEIFETHLASSGVPENHTMISVPLLRENEAIGAIMVRRSDVRPFSESEIVLLQTFAAQAVIAIENVRLFNETREALERQTATAEVLRVISGSMTDVQPVFDAIVASCAALSSDSTVGLWLVQGDTLVRRARLPTITPGGNVISEMPLDRESAMGNCVLDARLIHAPNIEEMLDIYPRARQLAYSLGYRSVVVAPLVRDGKAIGVLAVTRKQVGAFRDAEIDLLRTFADQAVIALENARLFREIQEKSAQLEIANKHKSEFLANMSHELRTPLNAIIGFSEVLQDSMFGTLNDEQLEFIRDIHESGKHLLSLINDILDLSKVEAGRMELLLGEFDLPSAVDNALALVKERAAKSRIRIEKNVDPSLGMVRADERKLKQILLNLLSNAVKFTPEGGTVRVDARASVRGLEISVEDTGVGIAAADHDAVFEEFRQVGNDYTRKAEGTGLGLALARRFVELHGGRIELESELGRGSRFTVFIPDALPVTESAK